MSILGDQELLGELGVIDSGARAASAIALRTTVAYRIPAELLATSCQSQVRSVTASCVVSFGLFAKTAGSWSSSDRNASSEPLLVPSQRIPEVLQRTSQGELAALMGISRQSLNQTLRAWEREGLIDRANGHMQVTDLDALRQRYLAG